MDYFRKKFPKFFNRDGFENQGKRGSLAKQDSYILDLTRNIRQNMTATEEIDINEMEILNCRDLSTAVNFFDSSSVRDELNTYDAVLFIQFQIKDDFGDLSETELSKLTNLCQEKAVVVFFAAQNYSKFSLYWKPKELQYFLMLNPYVGITLSDQKKVYEFVADFLANSLSKGQIGIQSDLPTSPENNKIELHSLADCRGLNLLLLAAESGNAEMVSILLEMGISPESSDEIVKAQDSAWKNRHSDVILVLLKANLPFPNEIDPISCSEKLRKFIKVNNAVHEAILSKNIDKVKELLSKNTDQRHFYNISNESAAKTAILSKSIEVYELLVTHNVFFGPHEDEEDFFDELEVQERRNVREIHFKHSKDLPEKHINALMSRSFVGHDVHDAKGKREHVLNAYKFLKSNAFLGVIVMIVAASKKFRSVFDFNRDSVYFADPTTSSDTMGVFYVTGRVYIGAKQLLDAATKYETYAILAHELCHYAVNLTYMNNAKPYWKNDNQTMQEFERISEKCQMHRGVEPIIDIVYDCYPPEMHHAELIVRVPHLIALYHDQPEKMEEVRTVFIELFEFYEKRVLPEMLSSLPEIEGRDEKEIEIKDKKIQKLKKSLLITSILSIIALTLTRDRNKKTFLEKIYDFLKSDS